MSFLPEVCVVNPTASDENKKESPERRTLLFSYLSSPASRSFVLMLILFHVAFLKAIRTMSAAALTTVAAFEMKRLRENQQAILVVKVLLGLACHFSVSEVHLESMR